MKERTQNYLDDFFARHEELEYLRESVIKAYELIVELKKENKLLICGNGGSCADSEHIAGELLKSFKLKRKLPHETFEKFEDEFGIEGGAIANNLQQGIKAIPLTGFPGLATAFSNDCNSKFLYAQLVNALGIEGDVLIAISTSGNSQNVVLAAKVAKALGIKVVALTGESGGQLKDIADILLNAPSKEVYIIQEYHLPLYHLICLCAESELFDE